MEKVVIIPALNPDEKLREIVEKNRELEHTVILVDDGSDESCRELFWELGESCIVLHHSENRGKGEAVKTALQYIKKELPQYGVIGIMDADGQHLAEDMEKLLEKAESHPGALVLGVRQTDGTMPWKSRFGNRITRWLFHLTTGVAVSDTQTGLRAFSRQHLDFMLGIGGSRYEYEMSVLTTGARMRTEILEVPIHTIYHDRENSCSHFRRVRDSVRIYGQLLKFSLVSFSSFLVDYGLFALFTLLLPQTLPGIGAANVFSRILSGGYNYLMNCRFVFHEKSSRKKALNYLFLALTILVLNSIILQGLIIFLRIPVYPAKILTECCLFLISWLVQKEIIFQRGVKIHKVQKMW